VFSLSADELGLADLIEFLPGSPHPVARDQSIVATNPLGKIPTLITRDGQSLYDSRVICGIPQLSWSRKFDTHGECIAVGSFDTSIAWGRHPGCGAFDSIRNSCASRKLKSGPIGSMENSTRLILR
jgi:hypothetical protein